MYISDIRGGVNANNKVIITLMCILSLILCIGCNKTDKKCITSNNNTSINEPKNTSQKPLRNEDIEEYKVKPNVIFYVLEDEYLENNDMKNPKVSKLLRVFTCYDGIENQIYPYSITIFFNRTDSIQELRNDIFLKFPSTLKLPPNTIVSSQVLKKWKLQDYDGLGNYSDESPIGLTYSKIQ